jgi:hypothetical protein
MDLELIPGIYIGFSVAVFLLLLGDVIKRVIDRRARTTDPQPPRDIDVNNPPHLAIYEDTGFQVCCLCHGEPFREGEKILIWPRTGGEDLLCSRTYEYGHLGRFASWRLRRQLELEGDE